MLLTLPRGGGECSVVKQNVVLVVEFKAVPIDVCRTDRYDFAVERERLGVEQTTELFIDRDARFQQVGVVGRGDREFAAGSDGNAELPRLSQEIGHGRLFDRDEFRCGGDLDEIVAVNAFGRAILAFDK